MAVEGNILQEIKKILQQTSGGTISQADQTGQTDTVLGTSEAGLSFNISAVFYSLYNASGTSDTVVAIINNSGSEFWPIVARRFETFHVFIPIDLASNFPVGTTPMLRVGAGFTGRIRTAIHYRKV